MTTIFGAPDADADLRVEIAPVDGVYGGLGFAEAVDGFVKEDGPDLLKSTISCIELMVGR